MADLIGGLGEDASIAFMVSAGLVYEIVAAACSSPQTTEINAGSRSQTLMKWVWLGLAQAALFTAVAAKISPQPKAVVAGAVTAAGLMLLSYQHAKEAGLASDKPGTES